MLSLEAGGIEFTIKEITIPNEVSISGWVHSMDAIAA